MGISQAACLLLLLCCAAPLRSVNGENPDLRTFLRTLDPAGGLTADLTANDGDICRVAGASCNGAGQLSELDLSGRGLSGFIPTDSSVWGDLTDLTRLDLSNNDLSGRVPTGIARSPKLKYINLSNNQLTGQLPTFEIDQNKDFFQNIEVLNFANNRLSGKLLWNWSALSSVRVIDLSNNNIRGNFPTSWSAGFPALESLNLSGNDRPLCSERLASKAGVTLSCGETVVPDAPVEASVQPPVDPPAQAPVQAPPAPPVPGPVPANPITEPTNPGVDPSQPVLGPDGTPVDSTPLDGTPVVTPPPPPPAAPAGSTETGFFSLRFEGTVDELASKQDAILAVLSEYVTPLKVQLQGFEAIANSTTTAVDSTAAARKLLSASRQLLQTGQGVWGYFYIQGGSLDELRSVNQKWNEVNNNFQGNGLPSILPTVSVVGVTAQASNCGDDKVATATWVLGLIVGLLVAMLLACCVTVYCITRRHNASSVSKSSRLNSKERALLGSQASSPAASTTPSTPANGRKGGMFRSRSPPGAAPANASDISASLQLNPLAEMDDARSGGAVTRYGSLGSGSKSESSSGNDQSAVTLANGVVPARGKETTASQPDITVSVTLVPVGSPGAAGLMSPLTERSNENETHSDFLSNIHSSPLASEAAVPRGASHMSSGGSQMDTRGEGSSATEGTVLFNSQQEESVMGMSTSASSNRGHGTTTHSSSGAVRTFASDHGGTPIAPIVASGGTHSSPGESNIVRNTYVPSPLRSSAPTIPLTLVPSPLMDSINMRSDLGVSDSDNTGLLDHEDMQISTWDNSTTMGQLPLSHGSQTTHTQSQSQPTSQSTVVRSSLPTSLRDSRFGPISVPSSGSGTDDNRARRVGAFPAMDDAHFINDLDHLSAVGLAPDMHMDSTAMSTQDLINEQAYSGLDTGDFLGTSMLRTEQSDGLAASGDFKPVVQPARPSSPGAGADRLPTTSQLQALTPQGSDAAMPHPDIVGSSMALNYMQMMNRAQGQHAATSVGNGSDGRSMLQKPTMGRMEESASLETSAELSEGSSFFAPKTESASEPQPGLPLGATSTMMSSMASTLPAMQEENSGDLVDQLSSAAPSIHRSTGPDAPRST